MSKKVALMCGHGTQTNGVWDPGTTYAGYSEAALMLPITKAAVKQLRARGVTVITDSDTGNKKNMILSVAESNKAGCDVYISVHCDWYKAGSGVYPLFVSAEGKKLATALNNAIKTGMPMMSRGICKRTDLYELNATDAYACVLECGSIKADLEIFKKEYEKYGKLIADGICNYLGIKTAASSNKETKKAESATESKKTDSASAEKKKAETAKVLYRVRKSWNQPKTQVGAFESLDNAKKECDKHPGYSVYGPNGKLIYTNTTAADKIVAQAKKLCWPFGTDEKKWAYKTGAALAVYKTALKEFMSKSTKIAQSDCGYFVSTCVRAAGVCSTFRCLEWGDKIPSTLEIVFKGKKIPADTLEPGDIIRYKKTSGSQHTMIYIGDGKIAEAGRKIRFPVIRKDTRKYNSDNVKHSTLQVLRAK